MGKNTSIILIAKQLLMKNNEAIIQYLNQQRLEGKDFVFEGNIENYVKEATGSKGDTISRVLRFMREDGLIIS